MKRRYKAICKIELYDLTGKNNFIELLKFSTNKIKIDGKDYYIGDIRKDCVSLKDCVSFIEFEQSEHEIEICEPILSHPTEKGGESDA